MPSIQAAPISTEAAPLVDAKPPTSLKLYQQQLLFRGGFQLWQIFGFAIGIVGSNFYLAYNVFPAPGGTSLKLEYLFSVDDNPVFKTFLLTSVVVILKMMVIPWIVVSYAVVNNSFSKNPEDLDTGNQNIEFTTSDPQKDRWNRIHINDLENVPAAILLALIMVLVQPDPQAATIFLWVFTISRCLHTVWYAAAGSHEFRATFFSAGVWANVGCAFQIIRAFSG